MATTGVWEAGSPRLERMIGYHSPVWWTVNICTYAVSAVAATAVIVRVLYGNLRRDKEAVVRVSIENLMAQLVVMVSFFDLVYDIMWLVWGTVVPRMLEPNEGESISDARDRLENYRRFFFVFTQLLMYASHLTLAAHLYAWVVRRSSPAKLSQRFLLRISLVVAGIFIVALCLGFGVAPNQKNQSRQCSAHSVAACYGYAMVVLAPGTVGLVTYFYVASYNTVKALVYRHFKTTQAHPGLALVSARIRNRLFKYTLLFSLMWGLDAILMWMYIFFGNGAKPNIRLVLQTIWSINAGLAGFMDAMVMGWRDAQPGRLTSQPHHTTSTDSEGQPRKQQQHAPAEGRDGSAALSSGGPSVLLELGAPLSSTLTMQMGPDDFEFDAELTPIKAARPRAVRRIFATTYNMGGSGGVLDPTQVAAWIPLNYDLYAVGLQECENVGEVVAVLQRRLTASGVGYRHFATEIGDATILHGKIALLVFGRASDLDSGALRRIGSQQGRVHNGLNLGIARAANKGMVGLSFRYHDQTLAFVNCHFAADSKGRSGTFKRVKDAIKTLRELVLVSEDTEYDCHLQFDHTILLGDCNFRVQETPPFVLQMVQESVAWEVEAHARRQERRGGHGGRRQEGGNGGNGGNQTAATAAGWRDVRHACFRVPKAALAARWEEEGGGEEEAKDGNGGGHGSVVGASEEGVVVDEEVVAAEWEDEMVVAVAAAAAEGGLDGSGGVREAEVERAQRMSRMLKSARAWNWLTETEELSIQMREGRLFCGFQEQMPRFPPSFKWNVGADAQGFLDPTSLDSLYKVSKKEGRKTGLRPPSYTDRVLVHSLPDERQRLRLKAYDLFETVTSSDHRPVALAMELLVQREVVGFEHVRDTKQPHPHQQQPAGGGGGGGGGEGREEGGLSPVVPFYIEAAICLCEVAISGLRASLLKQGRSQIGEIRILYPSLPEDPLKAQRAVLKLHDFVGFDHSRHYGSVPAVSRMAAAEPSRAPTAHAAAAAMQQQPPPLVARVTRLFSTITAGSASSTGGGSGRGRRLATVGSNGSGDHHPPGPFPSGSVVSQLMDPALLKSLHCFRWSDATREPSSSSSGRSHSHERAPVRFATLASLEHSSHALVKLVDKRGEDLGQGVICLRGLIRRVAARNKPRPAPPTPTAHESAVGSGRGDGEDGGGHPDDDDALERGQTGSLAASSREEDVLESVTVELSRGGEYRGVLECQVSLRLVGLRPQQLQAIARGSSVVSSAGSPKDGGGARPR